MKVDLKGKVVVITGASRGIGVEIARRMGAHGASLVLAARNTEQLEAVAGSIRDAGGEVATVACDVTDTADQERLVAAAEALGPIAVLINNAGVELAGTVQDRTAAHVDFEIAVNLRAPIQLTRLVLPDMLARGSGVIVQMSSMAGKSPTPFNAIYTATKYGLTGFTASLRIELLGTGVHTGAVCPGFVAGAGMWADTGLKAPLMFREVSVARVVKAVERVIDGAGEVLVTPGPIRPMLALGQLFPSIDAKVLDGMGVLDALKAQGELHTAQRS